MLHIVVLDRYSIRATIDIHSQQRTNRQPRRYYPACSSVKRFADRGRVLSSTFPVMTGHGATTSELPTARRSGQEVDGRIWSDTKRYITTRCESYSPVASRWRRRIEGRPEPVRDCPASSPIISSATDGSKYGMDAAGARPHSTRCCWRRSQFRSTASSASALRDIHAHRDKKMNNDNG